MIIITRRWGGGGDGFCWCFRLGRTRNEEVQTSTLYTAISLLFYIHPFPRHCLFSLWEVFMEFDVIELIHFSPFCIVASSEFMWMYLTHMCHWSATWKVNKLPSYRSGRNLKSAKCPAGPIKYLSSRKTPAHSSPHSTHPDLPCVSSRHHHHLHSFSRSPSVCTAEPFYL